MNLFSHIKSKLAIYDVVSEYTTLRKAGLYFKGNCPFHHERTASFTVSPHKEIFYCFGCHAGGDAISFVAKMENCSQLEAAKLLAERYQINLPEELSSESDASVEERKHYFELCKRVAEWAHENLLKSPSLLHYFAKRGFTQESIKHFTIGYFPGGLRAIKMFTQQMSKHNILPNDLVQAHILSEGKTVLYSPFEERILFPIKDHIGRFCGFGGRVFREHDERPKYYNSRESAYFSKGSLLFGFDLAKKAIQEKGSVFLVEGYTDCIAMAQHGFANTVATLGTACTSEHLKKLSRYANYVYVVYDGDAAGHKAIMRLTELCWQVSTELKVLRLPPPEDPASFLADNKDLTPLIAQAQDIFELFISSLGQGFSNKALAEKIQLTKKITETIGKLDDPLKQDLLLQKAAKTLDIPFEILKDECERAPRSFKPHSQSELSDEEQADGTPDESEKETLEKSIFYAIMSNIQLLDEKSAPYLVEYLPKPYTTIVIQLYQLKLKNPAVEFMQFFDSLNEEHKLLVSRGALEGELQTEAFGHLLTQLYKKRWKTVVRSIKAKLANAKREGNNATVDKIMRDFLELKQKMTEKNLI